ncbi:Surface polysaccharide O-acyltransferase, integral membrane enzyme [Pseudobutyrivibrio sp. ACV-2]|uniref:acyltransferase n=1 Tax=Pseudobutyrivibrio sp. ACV-2 TaxID=1520801 RepID=UPI0008993F64|nr:acyltransferase [Pseudobutyrivibrio sp. ACV-2]SEA09121.1 Surface polysaccharide O-acyltransferase, integral membrane enzyme [Pseudobutyrivibrio sp. ACV-2]
MKKSINLTYWMAVLLIAAAFTKHFSFIQDRPNIFIDAMALGAICAIFTSKADELYVKKSLALIKSNHTPIYDYLRTIAVILVIGIHVINWDLPNATEMSGTFLYSSLDHFRYWSFVCNALFVMLSGALLLGKIEPATAFYKRRVTKIAIPLVVYYLWYLWEYDEFKALSVGKLINLILTQDHVPHFWLINYLLLVYISMPLIRILIRKLSYKNLTIFMVLIAVASIIGGYFNCLNVPVVKAIGWILVSIVGYWCSKEETRRFDYLLIAAGLITSIFIFFIDPSAPANEGIISNLSIFRLLAATGIFSLLFKIKGILVDNLFVRLISKYGYGIMLIHMWVLYFVSRKIVDVSSLEYRGVGLVISIFVTLIISLIFTYFIDNLVINLFSIFSQPKLASSKQMFD